MNQHNNPPFQAVYTTKERHINQRMQILVVGKKYTVTEVKEMQNVIAYQIKGYEKCTDGLADAWYWEGHFSIITKRDHSNVAIEQSIKDMTIVEERSDVKKKEVVV